MEGIAYVDARELKLKGYVDSVRVVVVVPSERAKGHRLASGGGSRRVGPGSLRDRGRRRASAWPWFAGVLGGGLLGVADPRLPRRRARRAPRRTRSAAPPFPVLAFYDPRPATLKATTPSDRRGTSAFFSNGSFWILGENPRAFNRVDPASRTRSSSRSPSRSSRPAASTSTTTRSGSRIWQLRTSSGSTSGPESSSRTSRSARTRRIRPWRTTSRSVPGSVWLSRPDIPEITRLDAKTGKVQARLDVDAFGADLRRWGALVLAGRMARPDRRGHERADLRRDPARRTDTWLGNIYIGGGDAWTASSSTGPRLAGRPIRTPDELRTRSPGSVRWRRPSARCGSRTRIPAR